MIKIYTFDTVEEAIQFERQSVVAVVTREIAAIPQVSVQASPEEDKRHPQTARKASSPSRAKATEKPKGNSAKERFKERIVTKAKAAGQRRCGNCGEAGHQARTCPKREESNADQPTEAQIEYIESMAEKGATLSQVVMETGLPEKVVKRYY